MGKLRISTGLVLHDLPVGDVWDYMRRALDFHKAAGFDAGDLSLNLYTNLLGEKTPEMLERGMKYAEQIGLPIELCHLPFNMYNSPQEVFDARLSLGIDCAKQLDFVADGDRVVIAAGIPLDTSGNTNILKVQIVGSKQ